MSKRKSSSYERTNLQAMLAIFLIASLVWFSDYSVYDSIYLPRIVFFSIFTLILLIVCFNQIQIQVSKHPLLISYFSASILIVFLDSPFMSNFYGESQRINGTLLFILISTSVIIGLLSNKRNFRRVITKTLIFNGALVSILVIYSHFFSVQASLLRPWINGNAEGGINENFKSMFIAVSLALHLSILDREKRYIAKQYLLPVSMLIHLLALFLIGSAQGVFLVALTCIFIACGSKANLRFGVPLLSITYAATHLSFLYIGPLAKFVDSSTLERIYLARRGIELLRNAPLFYPNPYRISENDFSSATLTVIPGTTVWVDDVHNVFLNTGNTYGIILLVFITILMALFIIDFYKNALRFSWETKALGAIILATSLVLIITILNPIYFLPLCLIIGMYSTMRAIDLKGSTDKDLSFPNSERLRLNFQKSNLGKFVVGILVLQLSYGTFSILREYVHQRELNRIVDSKSMSGRNPLLESFNEVEGILESSYDLRFIYEVGRSYYLEDDCQSTKRVSEILRSRSSSHFLTKKMDSLYADCLTR
jgi:hypothetical protein